jgi:3-oxoacyl-[acyl-carrier protein] reductase
VAAAKDRLGRLDGALISVGGTPAGTVATTTDQAWRSGFETVFLGAVPLVRTLADELGGESRNGGVAGSVTGTDASLVLVLASSVRVPLPDLAISNGPGLAGVVKMLADEVGPAGIRINGVLPVRMPPTGSVNLMPAAVIPMRCVPACLRRSRSAGTVSPRSSGGLPRSCCPPPCRSSRAR